jgi:hypothetical protein
MLTIMFVIFIALAIADARLTWLILRRKNGKELNPVIRWAIEKLGLVPALVVKTVALVAIGFYSPESTLMILIGIYSAVVLWNFYQYKDMPR